MNLNLDLRRVARHVDEHELVPGERVERFIDGIGFKGTVLSVDGEEGTTEIRYEDGWVEEEVPLGEVKVLDVIKTARGRYEAIKAVTASPTKLRQRDLIRDSKTSPTWADVPPHERELLSALPNVVIDFFGLPVIRGIFASRWKDRTCAVSSANKLLTERWSAFKRSRTKEEDEKRAVLAAFGLVSDIMEDPVSHVFVEACKLFKSTLKLMSTKWMTDSSVHESIDRIVTVLVRRSAEVHRHIPCEAFRTLQTIIDASNIGSRLLCRNIFRVSFVRQSTTSSSVKCTSISRSENTQRSSLLACKLRLLKFVLERRGLESLSNMFVNCAVFSMPALLHSKENIRRLGIDVISSVCVLHVCDQLKQVSRNDASSTFEELREDVARTYLREAHPLVKTEILSRISRDVRSRNHFIRCNVEDSESVTKDAGLKPRQHLIDHIVSISHAPKLTRAQKHDMELIQQILGDGVARCLCSNVWSQRLEAINAVRAYVDRIYNDFAREDRQTSDLNDSVDESVMIPCMVALRTGMNDVVSIVKRSAMNLFVSMTKLDVHCSKHKTSENHAEMDVSRRTLTLLRLVRSKPRPVLFGLVSCLRSKNVRLRSAASDTLLLVGNQDPRWMHAVSDELLHVVHGHMTSKRRQDRSPELCVHTLSLHRKLLNDTTVIESIRQMGIGSDIDSAFKSSSCEDLWIPLRKMFDFVRDVLDGEKCASRDVYEEAELLCRRVCELWPNEKMDLIPKHVLAVHNDHNEMERTTTKAMTSSSSSVDRFVSTQVPSFLPVSSTSRPGTARARARARDQDVERKRRPSSLPYSEPLTKNDRVKYERLLTTFGESCIRCVMSKSWACRVKALEWILRRVSSDTSDPSKDGDSSCSTLDRSLRVLNDLSTIVVRATNDSVAKVVETAVRLHTAVCCHYVPTMTTSDRSTATRVRLRESTSKRDELITTFVDATRVVFDAVSCSNQRLAQQVQDALILICTDGDHYVLNVIKRLMLRFTTSKVKGRESRKQHCAILSLLNRMIEQFGFASHHGRGIVTADEALDIIVPFMDARFENVRQVAMSTYATVYLLAKDSACFVQTYVEHLRPSILRSLRETISRRESSSSVDLSASASTMPILRSSSPSSLLEKNNRPETSVLECALGAEIASGIVSADRDARLKFLRMLCERVESGDYVMSQTSAVRTWCALCRVLKQAISSPDCVPLRLVGLAIVRAMCLPISECTDGHVKESTDLDIQGTTGSTFFLAIPWNMWESRLAIGAITKAIVDRAGDPFVRVRESAARTLLDISRANSVGLTTTVRHLFAIEISDVVPTDSAPRDVRTSWSHETRTLLSRVRILRQMLGDRRIDGKELTFQIIMDFASTCVDRESELLRRATLPLVRSACARHDIGVIHAYIRDTTTSRKSIDRLKEAFPRSVDTIIASPSSRGSVRLGLVERLRSRIQSDGDIG